MGKSAHSVAAELLVPALRAIEALGDEVARRASESGVAILSEAGVALRSAREPAARIPHAVAIELLEAAVSVTGDPLFALRAGKSAQRGDFGLYQLLAGAAGTLRESLQLSERYIALLHDGARAAWVESGKLVRWEQWLSPGLPSAAQVDDYVTAAFLAGAHHNLGIGAPPIEVWLMHEAPAERRMLAAYEEAFGTRVRFGAARNALVMPRAALDLPMKHADAAVVGLLARYADEQLKELPRGHAFVERARTFVKKHLARDASLGALAASLHMSESSVQRRLQAHGTSHSALVDAVRRELATDLLEAGELNISEIAFRLGFAHRPAFHRAFRRWYGVPPKAHSRAGTPAELQRFYKRGS